MNRSDGVGVSEVLSRPPSLGYVRRYPSQNFIGAHEEMHDLTINPDNGTLYSDHSAVLCSSTVLSEMSEMSSPQSCTSFIDVTLDLGQNWGGKAFFYDSAILNCTFHMRSTFQLRPFNLDSAADAKRFHDQYLTNLLGPGKTVDQRSNSFCPDLTVIQEIIAIPHYWKFAWGIVWSGYTYKSGVSEVTLSYGSRRTRARIAHKRGRKFCP
ncbi:hypothetical protein LOC67_16850 [Stieleria sp. JC731]|uniref:hypothetical protein n=1 Tax=Stieleria sp. JC731 TaxID=2894195 RepID=UPI001E39E3CF|nr:hypothetical protein [Stieleria sp. JC731]MCC9602226.1 hypothetical protein [Stieleria sp. JC731]